VNVADAGRNRVVLMVCAREDSFQIDSTWEGNGDVYVVSNESEIKRRLDHLQPGQRISRIPGMRDLCNKVTFAKLMRRMQKIDPPRFAFFPRTYILNAASLFPAHHSISHHSLIEEPEVGDVLPKTAWKVPLIFKPADASCGNGISLLMRPWELEKKRETIKTRGTDRFQPRHHRGEPQQAHRREQGVPERGRGDARPGQLGV